MIVIKKLQRVVPITLKRLTNKNIPKTKEVILDPVLQNRYKEPNIKLVLKPSKKNNCM
jgi:hypothetical protein